MFRTRQDGLLFCSPLQPSNGKQNMFYVYLSALSKITDEMEEVNQVREGKGRIFCQDIVLCTGSSFSLSIFCTILTPVYPEGCFSLVAFAFFLSWFVIRRGDCSPKKNSRICSCHFKNGSKEELPGLFPCNKKPSFHPDTPHKVEAREKQKLDALQNLSTTCDEIDDDFIRSSGVTASHDLHPDAKKIEELTTPNALLQAEIEKLKKQFRENSSIVAEAENTLLRQELSELKKELERKTGLFDFKMISHSDLLVSHYTGLPNKETFLAISKLFDNIEIAYHKGCKVQKIDSMNQLFITLVKLRRGLTNWDLAVRFRVDKSVISNVFISWVLALHHILFKSLMSTVPSRQKNQVDLPECFSDYPNTRIIIDRTEIITACPKLMSKQNRMFSNYKQRITSKALVGIAPNGTVTFVSNMYPGSTSDKAIVKHCGVLKCLVPGDSVMADKEFCIDDLIPDGVTLNIPPFQNTPQFSTEGIEATSRIARSKIHVERAIARIKVFQILNYIPEFVLPYASEIFQLCAALTNFRKPLISYAETTDD